MRRIALLLVALLLSVTLVSVPASAFNGFQLTTTSVGNFIDGDLPTEFDDEDKGDLQGMADGSIEVYDQITN